MPQFRLIGPADYKAMPWRNGGGTTSEIAVAGAAGGPFRWRLSIAEVAQSGPFSDFAGSERVIAVVAGAGMRLDVAGRAPVILDENSPAYAFPGEAVTNCTLIDGPVRDFNLIFERSGCSGSLEAIDFAASPVRQLLARGDIAFLHAVRGIAAAEVREERKIAVPESATLRIDALDATLALAAETSGRALLAIISERRR